MAIRVPSPSRVKRSGRAFSSASVTAGKPLTSFSMRVPVQVEVMRRFSSSSGCQLTPALQTERFYAFRSGLPPLVRVTSTVSPVEKSNTAVLGVSMTGSFSSEMLGASS